MAMISGAKAIAICLKKQNVKYVFGIVGVPVTAIAEELQNEGVRFIAMRNEQAASYAAQAASYLLGSPQGCLVVSGPGVTNAISGLANAQINKWPMFLIGGASPSFQSKMGAFQEEKQLESVAPFVKFYANIDSVDRIPFFVEKAIRTSLYGEPGPTYLDIASDIIDGEVDEEIIKNMPALAPVPKSQASVQSIEHAVKVLQDAKTIVWNGPLGAFEIPPFDNATNSVAKMVGNLCSDGKLLAVAGGGDTVSALTNANAADSFSYLSTAGGAFLEWMEGKELPGVAVLSN